jgi:hypothetical protein
MKNEDTTGVVKPQIKGQTIAKRNETKKHTMNYETIHNQKSLKICSCPFLIYDISLGL